MMANILTVLLSINYIHIIWMFFVLSGMYISLIVVSKIVKNNNTLDDFIKPITVGFVILFLVPVIIRTISAGLL